MGRTRKRIFIDDLKEAWLEKTRTNHFQHKYHGSPEREFPAFFIRHFQHGDKEFKKQEGLEGDSEDAT